MKKMKAYVVTSPSKDNDIRVGDIVWLSENDDLVNATVNGWLSKGEYENDFEVEESKDYKLMTTSRGDEFLISEGGRYA